MEIKKDHRWIFLYSISLLCLTLIPYLIGFARQGTDWRFTGFVFGVEDGNSYIAKMLIGEAGKWLFRTPYTTLPQSGYLLFLPYLLIGKLASSPDIHSQLVSIFQIYRMIAGTFMIFATYEFIAIFIKERSLRRWGTVLATIGGGLGGLYAFGLGSLWAHELPLEFYSPETFGFLSIYGLPHLAMARGLLLFGLAGLLKKRNPIGIGGIWFAMGFFQPLTVVIAWSAYGAFLGLRFIYLSYKKFPVLTDSWHDWKVDLKNLVIAVVLSSPQVIYVLFILSGDTFFVEWTKQNIISSPPLTDYLLAYGLFLPFVVIGIIQESKNRHRIETLLLAGWFLLWLPFAYFPYNLQRRLPEGIWVVVIILTLIGFYKQDRWLKNRRYLLATITAISLTPALVLIVGGGMTVWNRVEPIYRHSTEVETFEYIQSHFAVDSHVLAEYSTANALPAWAPVITPIGHGPESVHLNITLPIVNDFYTGKMHGFEAQQWLIDHEISYIIWPTKISQPSFLELRKDSPNRFKKIYQNQNYQIYEFHSTSSP